MSGQPRRRYRRLIWLVAGVVTAMALGYSGWRATRLPASTASMSAQPPWDADELRRALDVAITSKAYQDGRRYLADPGMEAASRKLMLSLYAEKAAPDRAAMMGIAAHDYSLYVDLLRSLAPEQVEMMRTTRRLPFTELALDQQQTLLRQLTMPPDAPARTRTRESYIVVDPALNAERERILMFGWRVPYDKGSSGVSCGLTPPY